ncbi:MAG: D-alanine--D-alanine ligase [Clostridia bacterium]|nr:D-alanine--D-alanine ligase [Clostridia bacterium]
MKNVAVFFGGKSTEHDISIISANQVIKVLKDEFNIIPIYITKENQFYTGLMQDIKTFKNFEEKKHNKVIFVGNELFILKGKRLKFLAKIDIALPVMHGKNGEDGTLQGMLELLQIPYCESNVLSSAITMDKLYTKYILDFYNISNVEYKCLEKDESYDLNEIVNSLGLPLIVKPSTLGSSIGITKAKTIKELEDAIKLGFMFDKKVLVEKCLEDFKEYNISVLKLDNEIITSLVEQPLSKSEILTFKDKYKTKTGKGMENLDRIFPAQITQELKAEIEEVAKKAYKVFELNGVVRIDFLYKDKLYLNEINSIPGSLAYYLWKDKFTYKELLKNIIKESEREFEKKENLTSYFDGTVL